MIGAARSQEAEAWAFILGENVVAVYNGVPIIEVEEISMSDTKILKPAYFVSDLLPGLDRALTIHGCYSHRDGRAKAEWRALVDAGFEDRILKLLGVRRR